MPWVSRKVEGTLQSKLRTEREGQGYRTPGDWSCRVTRSGRFGTIFKLTEHEKVLVRLLVLARITSGLAELCEAFMTKVHIANSFS